MWALAVDESGTPLAHTATRNEGDRLRASQQMAHWFSSAFASSSRLRRRSRARRARARAPSAPPAASIIVATGEYRLVAPLPRRRRLGGCRSRLCVLVIAFPLELSHSSLALDARRVAVAVVVGLRLDEWWWRQQPLQALPPRAQLPAHAERRAQSIDLVRGRVPVHGLRARIEQRPHDAHSAGSCVSAGGQLGGSHKCQAAQPTGLMCRATGTPDKGAGPWTLRIKNATMSPKPCQNRITYNRREGRARQALL